jgi:NADH:flavin oxidoreductases, Old Yellow Enzyme family
LIPLVLGEWRLPNRVVLAPLTRTRASAGRVPNAMMAEYYRQRAGAGLMLSEATSVTPMGVGYPNTPGIWSRTQVEGWKLVTRAVHEAGGRILLQLWHVGRVSDPSYLAGELPVGPSAIAPARPSQLAAADPPVRHAARALREEIPGVVAAYKLGAENAQRAALTASRSTAPTAICWTSSCKTAQIGAPMTTAAPSKTARGSCWKSRTRSSPCGAPVGWACTSRRAATVLDGRLGPGRHVRLRRGAARQRGIAFIAARESVGPGRLGRS